jgi:hypothetical protein
MSGETWLNVSEAARAIGEHRQQLHRMMKSGRIPRRLIRDTSPPQLRLEGLAAAVAGGKRRRIDSRPAPPLEPQPRPDPVTAAELQLARVTGQAEAVRQREAHWIKSYAEFRQWFSEDYALELLRDLPDPCPIGEIMVKVRTTVLQRLEALDRCELQSRFPRQ